jgi:hypothetical protein
MWARALTDGCRSLQAKSFYPLKAECSIHIFKRQIGRLSAENGLA